MGTKNNPGAYDCYANAHPDEPMFVLLARDKHAPTLVWLWALLREMEQEDPNKVAEARDCVDDMIQWQVAHGRKAIGVGHAALVAVMGLIRAANAGVTAAKNQTTRDEELQRFICMTLFENPITEPAPPAAAPAADEWRRDDGLTHGLLSLVGGHDVPREAVSGWTDEQCRQADEWASSEHLAASDNDVERLPMPPHVAAHPPKPDPTGDLFARG